MKRFIALLLAVMMLLSGCSRQVIQEQPSEPDTARIATESGNPADAVSTQLPSSDPDREYTEPAYDEPQFGEDIQPEYANLSDPALLQYVEDNLYADLIARFDSEDYIIEDISAVYVSEEYLEEVAYNTKANIYFGYTLEELDAQFQGTRYIFSLGENGETVVEEFAAYDDIYGKVIKNVAIGTGVILVCVTVSVVSGGVGAPAAVSMIFASAAQTGTMYALSSGTISAVAAGTITGIQTGDLGAAMEAAALAGSESFKWGAITGVILGGAAKAVALSRPATTIPTPRQSEIAVRDGTKGASEQLSYLDGVEVPYGTPGSTRPDVVVKNANGIIEAIEVKNYNLALSANRNTLLNELERQVTSRASNLPAGSIQRIVLDVRGRGFSNELINDTITAIRNRLNSVYADIPITIFR